MTPAAVTSFVHD